MRIEFDEVMRNRTLAERGVDDTRRGSPHHEIEQTVAVGFGLGREPGPGTYLRCLVAARTRGVEFALQTGDRDIGVDIVARAPRFVTRAQPAGDELALDPPPLHARSWSALRDGARSGVMGPEKTRASVLDRALRGGAPRLRQLRIRAIATLAIAASTLGSALAEETLWLRRQDGQSFEITVRGPTGAACRGMALVSPGAGGSAQGYRDLAEAVAALGHLTVVIGHPESGRVALRERARGQGLREGLAELITEPEAYEGRFMDIAAARQWASSRCNAPQAILVGHSMGAATVMIEAGARNRLGLQGSDAFDAYIALSPQGSGSIFPADAWSDVRKPTLLLTGTRDSELGGRSWETRTEPFASLPAGCKWLGVIDGATHMHFAGNGLAQRSQALTIRTIGAFLQARDRGDCAPPPRARGIEISAK